MSQNKEFKSRTLIGRLIVPAGLLLILGSYILFVMSQDKLSTEVEVVTEENVHLVDTVKALHQTIDSAAAAHEEQMRIMSIVSDYYRFRNFQQQDSLLALLADTMEKFYLWDTASKIEIGKDFVRYWKRYPLSRYFLSPTEMTVRKLGENNYEVKDLHYYTEDGKTIMLISSTIRVNADKKIYYTRDVFAEQK